MPTVMQLSNGKVETLLTEMKELEHYLPLFRREEDVDYDK